MFGRRLPTKQRKSEWECSLSISTYLVQNGRDYANPNLVADRGWLHLEARYNYEAIKTGSLWLGYNFSVGKKLALEATPMLGGVFGDITGIAPGLYDLDQLRANRVLYSRRVFLRCCEFVPEISSIAGRNSAAHL